MVEAAEVLISLGCDYLTVTTKERDASQALHSLASRLFAHESTCGNKVKPWGLSGFSGYACGPIQIGERDDELCVRASSSCANLNWKRLVALSDNCSRIDLQATVQIGPEVARRIDTYKRAARRNSVKHGNKRRVRWVQEHHGGYTLYLGDRLSNVFGRIYDKGVESKMDQYSGCIRFEAQYQRKLSQFVARSLEKLDSPMPAIADYVSQFFAGRGVDLDLPYRSGLTYCCVRTRSDDDRCLEWLRNAVQPSVKRLIATGKGDDCLRALGLIDEQA